MADEDWGFTPPPFKAEEGLQRLQRDLRDLGLSERAGVWERRGVAIARLRLEDGALIAARVKRPSRHSPEWSPAGPGRTLKSAAEVRDFTADLKKHLAQWSDPDG